jgi:hypothetical protein
MEPREAEHREGQDERHGQDKSSQIREHTTPIPGERLTQTHMLSREIRLHVCMVHLGEETRLSATLRFVPAWLLFHR